MRIAFLIALIVLASCAKRPDAIAPIVMPANAYAALTCDQLAAAHRRASDDLSVASMQQNEAATGDAVGVFLIGVPVSSAFGGNKEGQVALHKGEVIAIEAEQRNKRC